MPVMSAPVSMSARIRGSALPCVPDAAIVSRIEVADHFGAE